MTRLGTVSYRKSNSREFKQRFTALRGMAGGRERTRC